MAGRLVQHAQVSASGWILEKSQERIHNRVQAGLDRRLVAELVQKCVTLQIQHLRVTSEHRPNELGALAEVVVDRPGVLVPGSDPDGPRRNTVDAVFVEQHFGCVEQPKVPLGGLA